MAWYPRGGSSDTRPGSSSSSSGSGSWSGYSTPATRSRGGSSSGGGSSRGVVQAALIEQAPPTRASTPTIESIAKQYNVKPDSFTARYKS